MHSIITSIFQRGGIGKKIIQRIVVKTDGGSFHSTILRKLYKICFDLDVDEGSYGWESGSFLGPAKIGKYCSIGPGVRRYSVNHCLSGVTTHPCYFNPAYHWVKKDFRSKTFLTIGNDVWIGANVIILPGCSQIGTGSVIGAGAVVTKDIGQYEIVAGSPARVIGHRFDKNTQERIIESKWWDLPEDTLKANAEYMSDPLVFLEKIRSIGD